MAELEIKSEIEKRKLITVTFLLNFLIAVTFVTWLIYFVYLFTPGRRELGDLTYYIFWALITITFIVSLFLRLFVINKNLYLCFTIVAAILIIPAFAGLLQFGASSLSSYLVLTIVVLAANIVWGAKKSLYLYALIVIGILSVNYAHLSGIIGYTPASSASRLEDSAVQVLLLGIVSYIAKVSYNQIEHSYNKAFDYAKELEQLNKHLDDKVRFRTRQLEKSFEMQANSIHVAATVGRITQPIIHDLKTSVSALQGAIGLIDSNRLSYDDREALELISSASDQISRIVSSGRELMSNSKTEDFFDPIASIFNIMNIVHSEILRNNIKIEYNFNAQKSIKGSVSLFERIITNILMNSIEELSTKEGFRLITISTDLKGDELIISIEDNGCGISKEDLPQLFLNDFTMKRETGHLGIGLPFVKAAMQNHFDAEIEVESQKDKFTKFILKFHV